jgi:hypothetical protein
MGNVEAFTHMRSQIASCQCVCPIMGLQCKEVVTSSPLQQGNRRTSGQFQVGWQSLHGNFRSSVTADRR